MKNHAMIIFRLLFGFFVITTFGVSRAADENNPNAPQEGLTSTASTVSNGTNDENKEETNVAFEDVPAPVKAAILAEILREVDELRLVEIEQEKKDGKTVYEAEFEYKDREIELEISADGKFLEKEVKAISDCEVEGKEE